MKKIFYLYVLVYSPFIYAQAIQSGLWKTKSVFTMSGIVLPSSSGKDCVSAEEAKDIKLTITKELKKNGCTLDTWKVKNVNLEVSLSCKNDQIDAKGNLSGTFTSKTYSLSGKAKGIIQGTLPANADIQLVGNWLQTECP